ncbi:hypothetical protein B5X24_HaOG215573 [Helicoverpa armigera]|nr:hypothetical protein B5X24_HaOG215573 [Helicoverpa armigera]
MRFRHSCAIGRTTRKVQILVYRVFLIVVWPWDVSDSKNDGQTNCDISTATEIKAKKRIIDETKRENRLRKIRGTFKKSDTSHQDATVSTTTRDGDDDVKPTTALNSPVEKLTLCCDRLLQEPEKIEKVEKPSEVDLKPQPYPPLPQMPAYNPAFMPEYLPTADIAHALGMPPINRKTWDHNAMIQGVNAVRRNEMGYLRAAKQFSVPKGTLERYVKKDVRAEDLVQVVWVDDQPYL